MKYKIIDNFLPQEAFLEVQRNMLGPHIPWAYNSFIVKDGSTAVEELHNYQFTHTFYKLHNATTDWINVIAPVLDKIQPSALVRIKANLMPRTDIHVLHEYHYDHDYFDGKIALFYVNTNDGYTIFEDGTKIESVENRLLIFNGDILHTGTTCTDQKVRCVINFMFYKWTNSTL